MPEDRNLLNTPWKERQRSLDFEQMLGAPVASAAAITPSGPVFHVTGTTNITSIIGTGLVKGVRINIIFDAILTIVDGSNLKLSANFITTADDTLTLVWDGFAWFEMARSVN